jgi:hypothetical protein
VSEKHHAQLIEALANYLINFIHKKYSKTRPKCTENISADRNPEFFRWGSLLCRWSPIGSSVVGIWPGLAYICGCDPVEIEEISV